MSNYPRDEFDRVPESSSRQGVHRARLEPPKSGGLALLITVGAIVLLIGAAAYFLFPSLGGAGDTETAATETSQQAEAGAAEGPADDGQPADTAEATDASEEAVDNDAGTTAAGTTATAEPTSGSRSPTPPPETAAVDKSTGVVVLNATGVPGLAGSVTNRLGTDGWAVTSTANWNGAAQPSSVIFYNGEEQLANAQALAAQLGIGRLVDTPALGQPLTVVLGPGFQ
jgi:hypothetical protein